MVEIKFDKEYADKYIRDRVVETLDRNKKVVLYRKPIMGFGALMILCGFVVTCIGFFLCGFARGFLGGVVFADRVSRLIAVAVLVFIWELIALDICRKRYLPAIIAYKEYMKERRVSLEELMMYCKRTCPLWCEEDGYGRYMRLSNMYNGYCTLVKLSKIDIVSGDEKGRLVTVKYADEKGDIDKIFIAVDEVRENYKIPSSVIEWVEGKVVYTEKVELAKEGVC